MTDLWGALSDAFTGPVEDMPGVAADNVLLAWPPVLEFLSSHVPSGGTVLDFGSGGGHLAAELHRRGYGVLGLDQSRMMTQQAVKTHGPEVPFVCGGLDELETMGTFNAIVSVMVLDFIEDLADCLHALVGAVMPGGVLVVVVHNRAYVKNWIAAGVNYVDFDSNEDPSIGFFELAPLTKIPIRIRNADEYIASASAKGLELLSRSEPPFTEEFLRLYPQRGPTDQPEHIVLGFRRPLSTEP